MALVAKSEASQQPAPALQHAVKSAGWTWASTRCTDIRMLQKQYPYQIAG
jgi:hypothetical protein